MPDNKDLQIGELVMCKITDKVKLVIYDTKENDYFECLYYNEVKTKFVKITIPKIVLFRPPPPEDLKK